MLDWFKGKKTYFVAVAMIVVAGLHSQGYIDDALYNTLELLLVGGGLAALRAGMKGGSQ